MPSMGTNFAEADGSVGQRLSNYYAARAKGVTPDVNSGHERLCHAATCLA